MPCRNDKAREGATKRYRVKEDRRILSWADHHLSKRSLGRGDVGVLPEIWTRPFRPPRAATLPFAIVACWDESTIVPPFPVCVALALMTTPVVAALVSEEAADPMLGQC